MGVDRPMASCKMPQTACGTPLHEAGGALGGRLNRCRVRPTGLSSTAQATFMLARKYDVSRGEVSVTLAKKRSGKRRMEKPRYYYPGEKPYRMIYMEDPFGNIVEIYSHSYELTYSEGAY